MQWPDCVSVMCSSSKDVYPKVQSKRKTSGKVSFLFFSFLNQAIEAFRNPILWIGNQKDGKGDSDLFLAKSAIGNTSVLFSFVIKELV